MSGPAGWHLEDDLAVIVIDAPPVNALSAGMRAALTAALDAAEAEPAARAILIEARGRSFSAGADITEFDAPPAPPTLPDLCDRIEAAGKPVVAALQGAALGGGCELALAAHYRIALATARLGLPEVGLGLLPGAGGTQRLPRLCGAGPALELMLSGTPIDADRALEIGLVDRVAEDELGAAARLFAREIALRGARTRPTRAEETHMSDGQAFLDEVNVARKGLEGSPLIAPEKIVDCVEAALLMPFETGLEFERAAFEDCLASDQSKALRHVFFAERRAVKFPDLANVEPRRVETVGVVGGGRTGAGIVGACLVAGLRVRLVERDGRALEAAIERVTGLFDREVSQGRMDARRRMTLLGALKGRVALADLADADLILEAVSGEAAAKRAVLAELGRRAKPEAVLATTAAHLDVNALAAASGRPGSVLGLHFHAPTMTNRLVEVVAGDKTVPEVLASGVALVRRLGRLPVPAEAADGLIGGRVNAAYRLAADICLEEGATPAAVDGAMRGYGFSHGPYQMADLVGFDAPAVDNRDPSERHVAIAERLRERGWTGRRARRGYYRYSEDGRRGEPDPEVLELIAAERARKGIVPRKLPADEIRRRCVAAMVNAGARLVSTGTALRPSDVDVAMIHGFGFPRWRGGPMMAADLRGLLQVRKELAGFAEDAPALWTPDPIFGELIKNGHRFADLNG